MAVWWLDTWHQSRCSWQLPSRELPSVSCGAGGALATDHEDTPGRLDGCRNHLRRAPLGQGNQHDAVSWIGGVEALVASAQRQTCKRSLRCVPLLHAQITCAYRPDTMQPRHVEHLPVAGDRSAAVEHPRNIDR